MSGIVPMIAIISIAWITQWYGTLSQFLGAFIAAAGIGISGYKRKSLDFTGMIGAFLVGLLSIGSSFRMGCALLAFYFSGSTLTKIKLEKKRKIGEGYNDPSGRNWMQVFCNGGVPTILATVYGVLTNFKDVPLASTFPSQWTTFLWASVLGYYCCCCGDTWASEVGIFSKQDPLLITTLKRVPRGTNGGVSNLGLGMSILGGGFIGLVYYLFGISSPTLLNAGLLQGGLNDWWLVPLGFAAGLFGSLLDSVLGATIQFTGYDKVRQKIVGKPGENVKHISGYRILDNNAVNIVSASTTAFLCGLLVCLVAY